MSASGCWHPAGLAAGDDGVEYDDELAHDGGDGSLEGFASGDDAFEHRLEMRIVASSGERWHIERLAGLAAPLGDVAAPPARAAVTIVRRKARECGPHGP